MDKQELKKQLEEAKKALVSNSKDAHFAQKLISDILSLKGQIDTEVRETEDIGKVIDELEGETFVLRKHEYGVSYHQYNSMDVRIRANITSAYSFISAFIDNKEDYKNLSEEEKSAFDITLSAMGFVLSIPTYCFTDETFFFNLAGMVTKFLRESIEQAMEAPLKEETAEDLAKNDAFREATLATEELLNEAKVSE